MHFIILYFITSDQMHIIIAWVEQIIFAWMEQQLR